MNEALPVPDAQEATPAGAGRKVLFSAMKNEAPFVLEWIAYHKVIGFDEIVICSNPSNDGMEEILAALAGAGEIRHLQTVTTPGKSAQNIAAAAFARNVGFVDGNWYLWLDGDEFLNVHVGDRTLDALISAIGSRKCALINWRIFGANGNPTFGGRFVDPAFVGAANPDHATNLEQKALFRFSPDFRGFALFGINRPLVARRSALRAEDVVTGSAMPPSNTVRINQRWLFGADIGGTARVTREEFGWSLAQINHYIVRTPEYFALKRQRGRGYKPDSVGAANNRHTEQFFREHDRNEAEDRSILHWQDSVSAEMERLMQIPEVASAVAVSRELIARLLAGAAPGQESGAEVKSEAEAMEDDADPAPEDQSAPAVLSGSARDAGLAVTLPAEERALLEAHYGKAGQILEYGCGGTTLLAAAMGKPVVSVTSDKALAGRVMSRLPGLGADVLVHHVDIGPIDASGRPLKPRAHARFHRFALSVWDLPDMEEPDLVLIAGPFRAACLAAVLLRARKPTSVLFADYTASPSRQTIERLARLEETVGRMARITVTPGSVAPELLTEVVGWFSDAR